MNKNSEIKPVPLNNLYYFNAHTRSDEDVVKTFIVRKEVLKELIDGINKERRDSIPQHYLIIGARGLGKSTLLKRLEIGLREENMKDAFIPIFFPEEQYNVDRISKFWLNSLDALADTFDLEKNDQEAKVIDLLIHSFSHISDENALADEAYRVLLEICQKYNRRPVFLIDNLDILFDGISVDQQLKLRKMLTSNGAPIFIGASTHNPDAIINYEAPFYDAFDIVYLGTLSRGEMRELLIQLAVQTNQEKSLKKIYTKTAQLNALHNLTGGNPRIAIFVFQLITNGLSEKIYESLNTLLDLITPLYKSNFEQLSKQAQIIVDALALHWDPCDLDTLSDLTKLENNQLSSQLDRLMKSSWIDRSSRFSEEKKTVVAKTKNYSIKERFFNIWYIMRRASRRQRGDLKSLTCFLETFYSPEHLTIEKRRILDLIKDCPDADRITYGLALSRVYNQEEQENEMEKEIYRTILDTTEGDQIKIARYLHPDNIPSRIYEEYIIRNGKWIEQLSKLAEAKEFDKAYSLIQSVIKNDDDNDYAWSRNGDILVMLNRSVEAETAYLKAIELNESDSYYWKRLARFWEKEGAFDKAEEAYKRTIQIDNKNIIAWSDLGRMLKKRKKYEEAENIFKTAISINTSDHNLVYDLAFLYFELKRYDDAESNLELSLSLDDKRGYAWNMYGFVLRMNKKYEEAETAYKKAIDLEPTCGSYWISLGDFYNLHPGKSELVEATYRKAIELNPEDASLYRKLGHLLQNVLKKYSDAEHIYKHIVTIENTETSWFELARFLHTCSQKFNEAEKAYRKALGINPQNAFAWGWLGMLYQYEICDYINARIAYENALENQPNLWIFNSFLGDLEQDYFKNYASAEKAYLNVIKFGGPDFGVHDYLFLLRDKLNRIDEAKQLFDANDTILAKQKENWLLHRGLFDLYESNWGQAKDNWIQSLNLINSFPPDLTSDSWYRAAATTQKLGYGKNLIDLFELTNYDRQLRPLFEALKALEIGNEEYLLNIAEEIREPARKIYRFMYHYNK